MTHEEERWITLERMSKLFLKRMGNLLLVGRFLLKD